MSVAKRLRTMHNHVQGLAFSNIASVATTLLSKEARVYPNELTHLARKARLKINESSKKLGEDEQEITAPSTVSEVEKAQSSDDLMMKEQLQFIYSVSADIDKTASAIAGPGPLSNPLSPEG